jgi:hypothetical protein
VEHPSCQLLRESRRGVGVPNFLLVVYNNSFSTADRAKWQPVMTDASGYATLKYTIPTNVSADNVRLLAEFGSSAAYKPASYSVDKISIG